MNSAYQHICTVCLLPMEEHCECQGCDEIHFPQPCCPGCDCGSFEEIHPITEGRGEK